MATTALALVSPSSGSLKSPEDISPRELWALEIEQAEKERDDFDRRGDGAVRQYLDERELLNADMKFFNLFYANTNILAAALYSQAPKPAVQRKYDDYRDQVARVGAMILERSLQTDLNDPDDTFDRTMRQCVHDLLVPGMGQAWLRLATDTESIENVPYAPEATPGVDGFTVPSPKGGDDEQTPPPTSGAANDAEAYQRIKDQRVCVDYVHWKDFLWSPCRTYEERRWVARRAYLTYDQLVERFGKEKADLTSLDYSVFSRDSNRNGNNNETPQLSKDVFQKATVYEIWDREKREVHWYAPSYMPALLDTRKDFLNLQQFEPCPMPMFANISTSSTMPRPDFYMLQDQYSELNTVNARISLLVSACKVVGVYDQSAKGLNALLTGNENTMVPVPDWGQFSEKGGVKGAVDWLPLEQIVVTLQRLYEAREAIKGQIYELSGISDIVRGDTKASETLGAQQIKQQFASIKIKSKQNEVARFASEILRIKAEIQVKHFTPLTLITHSGIIYTDNDALVPEAVAMIKSEDGFKWRIEIQSDSMAQADYEGEKKDRIEFMSMVTGYLTQALPIAGQIPEMKPVILNLLKWGMVGFKGSADIQGMIDKQLATLEGKPPPAKEPDPKVQIEQMKAQTAEKVAGSKLQIDQQKAQTEQARGQQEMELEQQRAQFELQMKREEMALEREKHNQEMAFEREKMELEKQKQQVDLQTTIAKGQIDMQTHQQVAQQKVQDGMIQSDLAQRQGEQQLEQNAQQHEQGLEQGEASAAAKIQQMKAQAAAKPKTPKE